MGAGGRVKKVQKTIHMVYGCSQMNIRIFQFQDLWLQVLESTPIYWSHFFPIVCTYLCVGFSPTQMHSGKKKYRQYDNNNSSRVDKQNGACAYNVCVSLKDK